METRGHFSVLIVLVTLIVARIVYVFSLVGRRSAKPPVKGTLSTLLVLGSGGHTAEMLKLVGALDPCRYCPRHYIAASTDTLSLNRAKSAEDNHPSKDCALPRYSRIYRSREVGQSYFTSVFTTLIATAHAFWLVFRIRPHLVAGLSPVSLVYVESAARVQKLSLTALILFRLRIADQMFVQWPELQKKYPGTHYVGRLM